MIALVVCGLLLSIGGSAGAWYSATEPLHTPQARFWLVCVCGAFALLGVYCLLSTFRSRVVLFVDRIEVEELTRTISLSRQEVRGWRSLPTSPPCFMLVPRDSSRRALKVAQVFPLDAEFVEWLYTLPSLDRKDVRTSKAEIRRNTRLGATPGERIKALARGRRIAAVLTAITAAVCLWGFVFPAPYMLTIAILTASPWIGLELVRRSAGLFRVDASRNDPHPTVAIAFICPSLVLLLRAVFDFNVLPSPAVWSFSLGISALLLLATLVADPSRRENLGGSLAIGLICLAYGYGVAIEANALFDHSSPTTYAVRVEDKYVSRGKTTTYNLKLGSWGPIRKSNTLQVSRATYQPIHAGDVVVLDLRRGALGINWYSMRMWHRGNESKTTNPVP